MFSIEKKYKNEENFVNFNLWHDLISLIANYDDLFFKIDTNKISLLYSCDEFAFACSELFQQK